jgi:extradiol dioxygenase family protein
MHRSRLAGFILDCQHGDLDSAARFWGRALGMADLGRDGEVYTRLDASQRDLVVEVQRVDHESRVHIDIESDDIDAEADRLERLGARRIAKVKNWWVLEAPTGQRFCVVRAKTDLSVAAGANVWEDER